MSARAGYLLLVMTGAFAACGNEPIAPETPIEMFDAFWTTFDRQYPYFEYKSVNWDSLRTEFRPRALATGSEADLIALLKEMVAPLRDLHIWFIRPDDVRDMTYSPTTVVNWDRFVWTRLTDTCNLVYARSELAHCTMLGYGYVFIGSWNDNFFSIADLDAVIDRYRDSPGMIVDVRPNGGGLDQLGLALAGGLHRPRRRSGSCSTAMGPTMMISETRSHAGYRRAAHSSS